METQRSALAKLMAWCLAQFTEILFALLRLDAFAQSSRAGDLPTARSAKG